MKGEDNETIGKELDKIEKCGIREVCLESRPHPDFCGPKWWENMDFICAEAEKRGLRLWILDDKKFPTGYANGGFEKHPEKSKLVNVSYDLLFLLYHNIGSFMCDYFCQNQVKISYLLLRIWFCIHRMH